MRKGKIIFSLVLLILCLSLCLSSCGLGLMPYVPGASGGDSGDKDYMTKEEVEALISQIEIQKNINVDGGDSYDIEITSNYDKNLLAASKALLSAVSISCSFDVTYTYSSGFFGQETTTKTEKKYSSGAGVIYQLDKNYGNAYIITNYHVVYNSEADGDHISRDVNLFLYGQEYADYKIPATYVGGSPNYDIAVLRVSGSEVLIESIARAADFADSNEVSVLDTAIAIGNPAAGGISATVGTVNVDSENISISGLDGTGSTKLRVMRIDAAVNSGNSGGGLFNDTGKVIGIVNAKMSNSASSTSIDNIGYAIPSNVAKRVADNIIYYNTHAGKKCVMRALLGVQIAISDAYTTYDENTGRIRKYEKVSVTEITDGSAADGALLAGDIINSVTIDGVIYQVTRLHDVTDAMLSARKTESFASQVVLNITRGGTSQNITIDMSKINPQEY